MLIHASVNGRSAEALHGDAHIILSVLSDGRLLLRAYRLGDFNALYYAADDSVLANIGPLLQELRAELTLHKA